MTENSKWSSEYFCFHPDKFIDLFSKELEGHQLSFEGKFFEQLKEKTKNQKYAPSFEQIICLYKECYQATLKGNTQNLEAIFNEKMAGRLKYFKP